jgi:hypothetical protein
VDRHLCWGSDAELHPIATDRQNGNLNAIANYNPFSTLPAQDQHLPSPPAEMSGRFVCLRKDKRFGLRAKPLVLLGRYF